MRKSINILIAFVMAAGLVSCGEQGQRAQTGGKGGLATNAAERVYVAPGEHDEYYGFFSGGFIWSSFGTYVEGNSSIFTIPYKWIWIFGRNQANVRNIVRFYTVG